MHVSGIDLSATATGVARAHLLGTPNVVCFVDVVGVDGITTAPALKRPRMLDELAREIVRLARDAEHVHNGSIRPDLIVIEEPIGSRAMGAVFERGYLFYEVIRLLDQYEMPTMILGQQLLKTYVLGKGTGTKGAMIDGIARRLPMFATNGDDNAADASAACALAAALVGEPLVSMPKTHLVAIDSANGNGPSRRKRPVKKAAASGME